MIELKLFVWSNFNPDYTPGLAFAIAKDEAEARRLVVKEARFEPGEWGEVTVHKLNKRVAYECAGGG